MNVHISGLFINWPTQGTVN